MPKISGIECLKELKNDRSLMHIPVVIYSTSSGDWDIRKALRLGAQDFVIKPTSCADLEKALRFLLKSFELLNK
jgi:CheY-like chemotaxis protein